MTPFEGVRLLARFTGLEDPVMLADALVSMAADQRSRRLPPDVAALLSKFGTELERLLRPAVLEQASGPLAEVLRCGAEMLGGSADDAADFLDETVLRCLRVAGIELELETLHAARRRAASEEARGPADDSWRSLLEAVDGSYAHAADALVGVLLGLSRRTVRSDRARAPSTLPSDLLMSVQSALTARETSQHQRLERRTAVLDALRAPEDACQHLPTREAIEVWLALSQSLDLVPDSEILSRAKARLTPEEGAAIEKLERAKAKLDLALSGFLDEHAPVEVTVKDIDRRKRDARRALARAEFAARAANQPELIARLQTEWKALERPDTFGPRSGHGKPKAPKPRKVDKRRGGRNHAK